MYIILDEEGYVKFLSSNEPMEGAIELPDDDSLNLTYITCYKLNSEGTGLMLDAEKLSAQKDALGVQSRIFELKQKLAASDFRVLGRMREQALGTKLHMSDEQYLMLEAERESYVRQIRELQDGVKLVTDVTAILAEGSKVREEKEKQMKDFVESIDTTIPNIKKEVEQLSKDLTSGDLIKEIVARIKESFSLKDLIGAPSQDTTDESNSKNIDDVLGGLKDLFQQNPNQDNSENTVEDESNPTESTEDTATTVKEDETSKDSKENK